MSSKRKQAYIRRKLNLLRQFRVPITNVIIDELDRLYPNDIYIENYLRTIILKHLNSL